VSPAAVSPLGRVGAVATLVWTGVPQASIYEVTLFAQDSVLWEVQTNDTFAVIPDSVRVAAGMPHYWQVRARIDWDRWSQSELAEFSVVPEGEDEP
jgi:hypothetical protein